MGFGPDLLVYDLDYPVFGNAWCGSSVSDPGSGFSQVCVSVSGSGFGIWINEGKTYPPKKIKKFHVLKCWNSFSRA